MKRDINTIHPLLIWHILKTECIYSKPRTAGCFIRNGTLTRFALLTLMCYVRFCGAFKAAAGELALHSTCTLVSERPAIHWGGQDTTHSRITCKHPVCAPWILSRHSEHLDFVIQLLFSDTEKF